MKTLAGTGFIFLSVMFLWGCELLISTALPECPPPIQVLDARAAGTSADTVTIRQGCPYISIDLQGDSTWVDYGAKLKKPKP